MRNIHFELYKPQSLADFLPFKKENPSEPMVYVLQHPPESINIMAAKEYGTLVFCLPEKSQLVYSAAPFVRKMKKNLKDFEPRDFILCIGDPAIIGLSTYIVGDITHGLFNMLKWDRQERMYYPLTFDFNQRLETGRQAFSSGGSTLTEELKSFEYPKRILEKLKIADFVEQHSLINDSVYLIDDKPGEKPTKRKKKKT